VVCSFFLADFLVRWFYSHNKWHFLGRNIFLLLVAIPYLNIAYATSAHLSHTAWVLLRLIPIARGIYGVSMIVSWMTHSKMTNLFTTYLVILFTTISAASCFTLWNTDRIPWLKITGTLSTGHS
jgi:voltage-gated potassium channel